MSDFPVNNRYTFGEDTENTAEPANQIALNATVANTKGAWKAAIASTGKDVAGLYVLAQKRITLGHLVDIGIGGAGSEQVIIENMFSAEARGNGGASKYFIPFHIPQGTRIAMRMQHPTFSNAFAQVSTFAGTFETDGACQASETFGANTTTSDGTVVDPGPTFNVYGSFVEFTSSTSRDINHLIISAADANNVTQSNGRWGFDVAIGGSGSEEVIIEAHNHGSTSTERGSPANYAYPVSIPAGTRIAVRSIAGFEDVTDRLRKVILIGIT